MSIQSEATEAARLRLYAHTVGVVNGVRNSVGTDPVTGLPENEEGTGTGFAGVWGKHHFVQTAKHVLEGANLVTYASTSDRRARCNIDVLRRSRSGISWKLRR